ncbi:nucleotidyltransferase domain-containing protein [Streptomyces polyrhachis]|uniref:Nucleotidyltransferase domain-containing protein n=1 Tax=Streptomyces polyrhachis TaxID=1282885 RepID=A0ABW2GA95_9ACTN
MDRTETLLARFLTELRAAVALDALWLHGSLALGDYQEGASDIDAVAVLAAPLSRPQRGAVVALHRGLEREGPLAGRLHCNYVVRDAWDDPARPHLNWSYNGLRPKPISLVWRRELLLGEHALYGPGPRGIVPEVADADLAAYIRADVRDVLLPAAGKRRLWLRDMWVDYGPLMLARASVTLADGRLITKRAALGVLADLAAPPELVEDIRRRRYEAPAPAGPRWRLRRARLARAFLREGIPRVLARPSP